MSTNERVNKPHHAPHTLLLCNYRYEAHFSFARLSESVEDLETFNADLEAFHRHSLGKLILAHLELQRAGGKDKQALQLVPKVDRPEPVEETKIEDGAADGGEAKGEQKEGKEEKGDKKGGGGDDEDEDGEDPSPPSILSVPKEILTQSYATSVTINGTGHDIFFYQGGDDGVTVYARDEILAWHAIKTTMDVARNYSSHPDLLAENDGDDEASMFERLKRCLMYIRDEEDRRKQFLVLEKHRPKRKVRRQTRKSIIKRKGGRGKVLKTVVKKEKVRTLYFTGG